VKKIRKRLTYANVMSSIAVFLVIGGATAFAALGKNTVGSKQLKKNSVTAAKIKKNAVTGAKVKDGSLTGSDINLGTLGTVPNASHATNADNATNAGNSNTVAGNTLRLINFSGDPEIGPTEVLNLNGFTLTASCEAGDKTVVLANGPNGSRLQTVSQDSVGGGENKNEAFSDDLGATPDVNLLSEDDDLVVGHTEFSLGNGGRAVSVVWEAEGFSSGTGPDCTFTGYAIG
jgi:azurin